MAVLEDIDGFKEGLNFSLFLKYNYLESKEILQKIHFPLYDECATGGSSEGPGGGLRDFIPGPYWRNERHANNLGRQVYLANM